VTRQLLLFAHLAGVVVWVGGMFFAYFCLRPAAARVLEPSQRLPLWAATFETFLRYAAIAVVVIVLSGFVMFFELGFKRAPMGWHVMMSLGLVMALIFGYVYAVLYPRLRTHCLASAWPAAGAALNSIRRWVAVNLALGVCTIAAALWAR
jgi:uncharacterized membrane protein